MENDFMPIGKYPGYGISKDGRVRNNKTLRILKTTDVLGRPSITLKRDTCFIHKLMAEVFLNHVPNGMELIVDHIDGDKTNNRLDNLQIISQRQNVHKNKTKSRSGFIGVHKRKSGRFFARIQDKGKVINLGTYDTAKQASEAYENKLKELLTKNY